MVQRAKDDNYRLQRLKQGDIPTLQGIETH